MVTKLLCASAVLAAAGAAQGASFQVNACDAGVIAGGIGQPITWAPAQASFTDSRGAAGVFAPDADGAAATTGGVFDNYFGMDPLGPTIAGDGDTSTTGDGYSSNSSLGAVNPGSGATLSGFRAGIAQGVWFSTSFVNSGPGDRMFVMNLSLRSGNSDPTTAGLVVNIRDGAAMSDPNHPGTLGPVKFGLANASNNAGAWAQAYYLDWVATPITGVNATFNGGTSYAIYVRAVPAPGAAALAGLAGLVAIRRRR